MCSRMNLENVASIDSCMESMLNFLNQMKQLYGPRDLDEAKPFISHLKKRFDENIDKFVTVNFPENIMKNVVKHEVDKIVNVSSDDESTPPIPVEQKAGMGHSMTLNGMPANSSEIQIPEPSQIAEKSKKVELKKLRKRTRYICDDCKYDCDRKSRLETHMAQHHMVRPFVCDKCNAVFSSKCCLVSHKTTCNRRMGFRGFQPLK